MLVVQAPAHAVMVNWEWWRCPLTAKGIDAATSLILQPAGAAIARKSPEQWRLEFFGALPRRTNKKINLGARSANPAHPNKSGKAEPRREVAKLFITDGLGLALWPNRRRQMGLEGPVPKTLLFASRITGSSADTLSFRFIPRGCGNLAHGGNQPPRLR